MGLDIDRDDALNLWRAVTLESVRGEQPDLTPRQLAVLMTVYLSEPPHGVRQLAERLGAPKPAISRAVDALSHLGFVRRKRDPDDGRNVLLQRTVAGSVYLSDFADSIARAARSLDD